MRNFLLFIVALGVFFGCSSSDYKLKGRNEGGKVVIAPVDAGGTEKIMIEYNPNTNEVSIPAGNKLKVDVIEANSGGQPEGGVPSGMIAPFAGATPPDGWLLCDGSEVSETTYARLFAAIGTTWNLGARQDGTGGNYTAPSGGNFRLPDLRGTFLRGAGTSSRTDGSGDQSITLGAFRNDSTAVNGMAITGSVGNDNISSNRSVTVSSTGSAHTHTVQTVLFTPSGSTANRGAVTEGGSPQLNAVVSSGLHSHSGSYMSASTFEHSHSDNFGLSGNTETGVRATGVNYIIKY